MQTLLQSFPRRRESINSEIQNRKNDVVMRLQTSEDMDSRLRGNDGEGFQYGAL